MQVNSVAPHGSRTVVPEPTPTMQSDHQNELLDARTFLVLRRVCEMRCELVADLLVVGEHTRRYEREQRVELVQIVLKWRPRQD